MSDPESPCRLYVYLASDAPVAVVLRRGPSAWSRLSLWHTDTDTFEHGQWLHGRVYPRRCDLSPDGSLFAYFVHKATGGPEVQVDSWAAVSRPPYFTALALWPVGTTYFAGGFFVDDRALFMSWITADPEIGALPLWLRMTTELPHVRRTPEWTDQTVHFNRLLRDGWTPGPSIDDPNATWERGQPGGDATLIMAPALDAGFSTYGGRHVDDYAVVSPGGETEVLGRATWADFDQRGRLLIAQDGCLRAWTTDGGLREIADFNDQSPETEPSPSWARTWPRR
jgi:hypothetical protein